MKNKSGSAVFMYLTIYLTAAVAAVSLALYYFNIHKNGGVLWVGIVAFMILYHFGLRILFGEITKRFNIDYNHPFYRQKPFEKRLYKTLKLRKWKDKVLTFDPEAYNFQNRTLEQLATTMSKSELDHWINEIISLVSIFFAILWGTFPVFLIQMIVAMLFDAQFIVVQRYNRPIVLRLKNRLENKGVN
jgi:glycosyl-4,4'-diaponeurosporenoate acyltransferase